MKSIPGTIAVTAIVLGSIAISEVRMRLRRIKRQATTILESWPSRR